MKKILILILFISSLSLQAQTFPDYKERNIGLVKDSTLSGFPVLTPTEGSIDPTEYILGPGDKIFISISGLEEIVFNLIINQEGNLYIPKVGGIDLKNTTLAEGKDKIINAVNRFYKNVEVFVTLIDFRKIKVSLLGNVRKPSSQILPANARLMDLISLSEGLTETSNYRNIKILNRNGEEKIYDLLSFLRYGDKTQNPYLSEGDVVIIDKVDKIVTIYGEVKYPGVYEFVDGETVTNLINLAGGFTLKAKRDTIEIVSFDSNGDKQFSNYFTAGELFNDSVKLKAQDRVIIRQLPEYYQDRYVRIDGFVKYPGWFKIVKDSTTLKEIISEAGGFLNDASFKRGFINTKHWCNTI